MLRPSKSLLKAALSALHFAKADALLAPFSSGDGVIFTLHHVTPDAPREFDPNGILKVTPAFLDSVIRQVRAKGFDIIALDDVPERLANGGRPFAAFTLDDGYRDNRDHAYPVFKAHDAPFAIYVPTDYADGHGELWWLALEEALRRLDVVAVEIEGEIIKLRLATDRDKAAAFETIYWRLRAMPEADARIIVRTLAASANFDVADLTRELVMGWDELRALASDPLVTIGAHTRSHYALAKLPDADARAEIADSVARIEAELGRPCRHFSFPYGCEASASDRDFAIARDLGLATAVTTRKGLLRRVHAGALTALPRVSLNGAFQDIRYVDVLLSGAPFAFLDAANKVAAVTRRTFAST
ncbi:MAG: polysaccharide deacetylase family protein [Hyphomicrobium sp.]